MAWIRRTAEGFVPFLALFARVTLIVAVILGPCVLATVGLACGCPRGCGDASFAQVCRIIANALSPLARRCFCFGHVPSCWS